MPSFKQLAILGLSGTLVAGCGGSNPDNEARTKMNEGRIAAVKGDEMSVRQAEQDLQAAASVQGISDATAAQAHAVLGQVKYDSGLGMLRDADRKELAGSRIALQIAALGAQLGDSAAMVQGYQKLDPSAAMKAISLQAEAVKGAPDKATWTVNDQAKLTAMTEAAAQQEISRVQGEIGQRQAQIKDLESQRVAALKEADDAMKASDAAKGQESVDQFKKYSDAKKKAADIQSQIDVLNGQIVPLQTDLEIAVGQQQIMAGTVEQLQAAAKSLGEGWKDIQSKITAQTDLIAQIASAPAPASTQPGDAAAGTGTSIAAKATALAAMVKEADDARSQAAEQIQGAIDEFQKAASAANQAGTEMSQQAAEQPNLQSIIKITRDVLSVHVYKLQQASAERVFAEMQLSKAAGISARIKLRELIAPLMQQANQPMPKELADPTLDNQLKEAVTAANEKFKDCADHLEDILGGPGSDPITTNTKKAAAVSKIFLLNDQQQLALLTGDKASADKFHAAAIDAVKAAADLQVTFPALPGDLASAIPPPPAPATTESPTTSPSTEAATAQADSPDVLAIRAVTTQFIQALDSGDADAAKALCQIEPGQEDAVNQLVTAATEGKKFAAAVQAKFGAAAGAMANMVNVTNAMAAMKTAKITVNGNDGMMTPPNGGPPKKEFAKVNDQWKIYVGVPDDSDKAQLAMLTKLNAALPTLTADVQAGKYETLQQLGAAVQAAMGAPAAGAAPAPAPAAPAPSPGAAPAPVPGAPPAPAPQ